MPDLLLLVFVAVVITSTRSENIFSQKTSRVHRNDFLLLQPKVFESVLSQHSNNKNEAYSCVCFDKSQLPVSEALRKGESNLKRLVVYLYKDSDTNTLQIYTPNKEKQVQFPDLGIEDGDLFKIGFETVNQVFNANNNVVEIKKPSNYVTVSKTRPNVVDISPMTETHGEVNEGHVPIVTADSQTNSVSIESLDNENNFNENEGPSNSQEDQDRMEKPTEASYNYPNEGNSIESAINEFSDQNEGKNEGKFDTKTQEEKHEGVPVLELPLVEVQAENSSSSNSNNPSKELTSVDPSSLSSEAPPPESVPYDLDYISPIKYDTNNIPQAPLIEYDPKDTPYQKITTESTVELKPHLQTPIVKDYNPAKETVETLNIPPKRIEVNNNQGAKGTEYVTFDIWFAEQMQRIRKTGKAPNKNIDLSSLKHLIEKTLFENGLYVTKDGVLTDSKANALDVSNLKLRPILIGDSLTYDNIFSENDALKFELPSNLPYLESVLVTLINPPKILGVIPIRKTFVPRVSYRAGLDYWAWREKNHSGGCKTWQCFLQKINKDRQRQYYNVYPSRGYKKQHLIKLTRKPGKTVHQFGSSKKLNKDQVPLVKPTDKYNNRFNLKNVLQAFQSAIFNAPNNKRKGYVQTPARAEPKRSDYEVVFQGEPIEEDDEGLELPGFRIIGGLPATSSGTPVSSKGRAGFSFS